MFCKTMYALLIAIIFLMTFPSHIVLAEDSTWQKIYADYLESILSTQGDASSFALLHLDEDDISELLINNKDGSFEKITAFTIKNNQLIVCSTGIESYLPLVYDEKMKALIVWDGGSGGYSIDFYTKINDLLKKTQELEYWGERQSLNGKTISEQEFRKWNDIYEKGSNLTFFTLCAESIDYVFGVTTNSILSSSLTNTSISNAGQGLTIKEDNSLWVWGSNIAGQLGNGTTTNIGEPFKVMEDVSFVSAGESYTMVIKTDGSLWGWGSNYLGKLGDGTIINKHKPVKIMDEVSFVSAGSTHTMAIKTDGSLWGWGDNKYGALGDGTTVDKHKPVKIMDDVSMVSAGFYYTTIVKIDRSLWVCGLNSYSQLGDGTRIDRHTPVKIMDDVSYVVASDPVGSTILKTDGTLWTWELGYLKYGDLAYVPVKITDNVLTFAASGFRAMIIKTDGNLWAWGLNSDGILGDGTATDRYTPIKIMDNVSAVSINQSNTLVLKSDGSLWSWGANYVGQIGNGTITETENLRDSFINTPIKIMDNVKIPNRTSLKKQ